MDTLLRVVFIFQVLAWPNNKTPNQVDDLLLVPTPIIDPICLSDLGPTTSLEI